MENKLRFKADIKTLQIYGYRLEKKLRENGKDPGKMISEVVKRYENADKRKAELSKKYMFEDSNKEDKCWEYAEMLTFLHDRISELKAEKYRKKAEAMIKNMK